MRGLGTMRSVHGDVKRCPVCGSGVVDRFGPWPVKRAILDRVRTKVPQRWRTESCAPPIQTMICILGK